MNLPMIFNIFRYLQKIFILYEPKCVLGTRALNISRFSSLGQSRKRFELIVKQTRPDNRRFNDIGAGAPGIPPEICMELNYCSCFEAVISIFYPSQTISFSRTIFLLAFLSIHERKWTKKRQTYITNSNFPLSFLLTSNIKFTICI